MSNMIYFLQVVRLPCHKDLLTLPHRGQPRPLSKFLLMVALMLSEKMESGGIQKTAAGLIDNTWKVEPRNSMV